MGKPDLSDYKEVSERIRDFREKYPEGCLQSEILDSPRDGFIVVKAYAYRTPDDPRPGVGLAWEPVPGKTPYTKDSELMNAETSAWGRAIIAVGASDAQRISSREEVRNREEAKSAPIESDDIEVGYRSVEGAGYLSDSQVRELTRAALESGLSKSEIREALNARGYKKVGSSILIPADDRKVLEEMFSTPAEKKSPEPDYDHEDIPF